MLGKHGCSSDGSSLVRLYKLTKVAFFRRLQISITLFGTQLLYYNGQVLGHAYGMVPADAHAYSLSRRFAPHLRFSHGHQLAPCSLGMTKTC